MAVPSQVMDEIMDIFRFDNDEDAERLRAEIQRVLERWWHLAILMPDEERNPWEA